MRFREYSLGLGSGVPGSGIRGKDSGIMDAGAGFRVQGSGFRVQGFSQTQHRAPPPGAVVVLVVRVKGKRLRVQGSGIRVGRSVFRVWG